MNIRIGMSLAALALLAASAWVWHDRATGRALLMADPDALAPDLVRAALPEGKAVYAAHCASCHGATAAGDPGLGVPSLADADWLYGGKVSEIEQTIAYGIRAANGKTRALAVMPAYATARPSAAEAIPPLAPGEIADLTEYLLTLEGRDANPESARRGAVLFQDKGGCFDCHGVDAKGDPAIGAPDLTDLIRLKPALADTISHGSAGMCPAWSGRLTAREIRAAALYLHSLSHAR